MLAMWRYNGDLKAKSRSKDSQVVEGVGPRLNSQVVSRWSNRVLSDTLESTLEGAVRYTWELYLLQQGTQIFFLLQSLACAVVMVRGGGGF